jgi:hypothetical protein
MLLGMGGNASLNWVKHRNLLFVAQNPGLPTPEDWAHYFADISSLEFDGVLVIGHDNKLSVSQRSDVDGLLKRRRAKLALVTNSVISRGVLTALSWLGLHVKAFAPTEVWGALAFLAMPLEERSEAVAMIEQLQRDVRARVA